MAHEVHEAAEVFPTMEGSEFDALVTDIREHGLMEPIALLQGKILDGRNRLAACEKAGVEPTYQEINLNGISPIEYVISKNVHRRHLSPAQRASLALLLIPQLSEEAKERMAKGGEISKRGQPGKASLETSDPINGPGKTSTKAAEILSVGVSAVETAISISKRDPKVIERMRSGELNVAQAARLVGLTGRGYSSRTPLEHVGIDETGRNIPIYYGKGDKWKEAIGPLVRYLTAWEKKGYEFKHINAKEAKRRLALIEELKTKLSAAEEDLKRRAHQASLRAPNH